MPVPTGPEHEAALVLVREVFADDFDKANRPEQKLRLARKLLEASAGSKEDPGPRYVLLRLATDLSTDAGDAETATDALVHLSEGYQVSWEQRVKDVGALAKKVRRPDQQTVLALHADVLADGALAEDSYDAATPLTPASPRT